MKLQSTRRKGIARRVALWSLVSLPWAVGCRAPLFNFRGQSPEPEKVEEEPETEEDAGVDLVRDYALPSNISYVTVHGIGMVLGLNRTGSDPPPDNYREALIDEMQTHSVEHPERLLASEETSLVLVRGVIPPGAQRGDKIDLQVTLPRGAKTTSLREGWLMRTRLREHAVLKDQVRTGRDLALGVGSVVVDGVFSGARGDDAETVARVLGGGVVTKDRSIGLRMRDKHASPFKTAAIGTAVNARFSYYMRGGHRKGVATPHDDVRITLGIPKVYVNNIFRYMDVVRHIAISEAPAQMGERLQKLERMLNEPSTASRAAIRLEAIGEPAAPILKRGVNSTNPEVNFYSAEALAYLDIEEAAVPLALAARNERAFRWHALTALSTMHHVAAYDALVDLLNDQSAETRYGAFRALRERNGKDPLTRGESLVDGMAYHRITTSGEPMIHFSSSRGAELVLFGLHQPITPPAFLMAGRHIMIKGLPDGRLKIIRFHATKDDEELLCNADADSMIRAIAKLGGGYVEIYEAFQAAKERGYLPSRLAVNAKARRNRAYHRDTAEPFVKPASPVPLMYEDRLSDRDDDSDAPGVQGNIDDEFMQEEPPEGFFGKMKGRPRKVR